MACEVRLQERDILLVAFYLARVESLEKCNRLHSHFLVCECMRIGKTFDCARIACKFYVLF